MSKKLIGLSNKKDKIFSRNGNSGQYQSVPINIDSIKGQRPTMAKRVRELLDQEGGFQEILFSPVLVAHIRETDEHLLVDGDHRRCMLRAVDPMETQIDAWVVEVETYEEANTLFKKKNKDAKTKIKSEDVFFNDFASNDKEAIKFGQILSAMKMRITSSPSDRTGEFSVGDPNGPAIAYTTFKKVYKECAPNTAPLYLAADLINHRFKGEEKLQSELFSGLVCFYKTYFDVLISKTNEKNHSAKQFEKWFKSFVTSQKRARYWKVNGGNVDNHRAESVCIGMLGDFLSTEFATANCEKDLSLERVNSLLPKANQ